MREDNEIWPDSDSIRRQSHLAVKFPEEQIRKKGLSSMVHAILTNLSILSGQYNFLQKKKKGGNQRDTDIHPKSR